LPIFNASHSPSSAIFVPTHFFYGAGFGLFVHGSSPRFSPPVPNKNPEVSVFWPGTLLFSCLVARLSGISCLFCFFFCYYVSALFFVFFVLCDFFISTTDFFASVCRLVPPASNQISPLLFVWFTNNTLATSPVCLYSPGSLCASFTVSFLVWVVVQPPYLFFFNSFFYPHNGLLALPYGFVFICFRPVCLFMSVQASGRPSPPPLSFLLLLFFVFCFFTWACRSPGFPPPF